MTCANSEGAARLVCEWLEPPSTPTLSRGQVDLWKVPLKRTDSELQLLEQSLARDERTRAERFRFDRDRRRFIAAHGLLRSILGRYIDVAPSALRFASWPLGKPFLVQPPRANLTFNLSHSGELALVAVTQDRRVGIDIEEIRFIDEVEVLAQRFLSPQENLVFQGLACEYKLEAFFDCWTRKEAYVKATGDGLSRRTESFDVAFAPRESARLLNVEGQPKEASRWSLLGLVPASGYVGAIAVEGHNWTLGCWQVSALTGVP